jgi:hypothetical protein
LISIFIVIDADYTGDKKEGWLENKGESFINDEHLLQMKILAIGKFAFDKIVEVKRGK